jgi:TDG/mug DNA glycosylase family protein
MISGFLPVSRPDAKILILGSMPGIVSLQQFQYYAHPRNLFWPFMAELLDFPPSVAYEARLQKLTNVGIALWDVVDQCYRQGSLDSAIKRESMQANDFGAFFKQHTKIHSIFFNGKAAESIFRKKVLTGLQFKSRLTLTGLPSTSPANASIKTHEKLRQWQQIIHTDD